ncbi:MAG: ribonuclease J [Patescibacteria group bacterium]
MNPKRKNQPSKSLRIIPLGGQEEVGRNMTLFEYGRDIVILDMGLQFPEEDMPGIDYIIPNVNYLRGREKNIRGVIFTHGHLDHIGAAPILLEKLGNPLIIGRPLTLALIKNRQEDYKKGTANRLNIKTVKSIQETIRLGSFTIRFFAVDHSIMDAVGVVIESPRGTVIHPGDWTYEKDPIGRQPLSYHHLARLKRPTLLMLESLAATEITPRVPEKVMYQNLEKLIADAPGRIIIGTFSSQIERIITLIPIAEKYGRKIVLDGYSMKVNVEIAQKLGYLKVRQDTFVPINKIDQLPDKRILMLCTGAQGEPRAALPRIVDGSHRFVRVKKSDTIIFSSSVIPGNERTIQRLKDNLYRLSDNVIHSGIMDVHSSGHSSAGGMLEIVKQIKPNYFLPVYANYFFLKEAEKLMVSRGFPPNNVFVLDNGSVLEMRGGQPRILNKKVPTDNIYVDGLGIGDVSHIVLRDRQHLANEGMVVIIVNIEKRTGRLVSQPEILSRGFVYMKDSGEIINKTKQKVQQILKKFDRRNPANESVIRRRLQEDIGQLLYTLTERRPMVLPIVIDV